MWYWLRLVYFISFSCFILIGKHTLFDLSWLHFIFVDLAKQIGGKLSWYWLMQVVIGGIDSDIFHMLITKLAQLKLIIVNDVSLVVVQLA